MQSLDSSYLQTVGSCPGMRASGIAEYGMIEVGEDAEEMDVDAC